MSDSTSVVPTPPDNPVDPLTLALKEVFGEYVSPAKVERVREILKTCGVDVKPSDRS
jgi:hypothetical protein